MTVIIIRLTMTTMVTRTVIKTTMMIGKNFIVSCTDSEDHSDEVHVAS